MARHPGKASGSMNLEVSLFGLPLISISWSRVDSAEGDTESVSLGTDTEMPEDDQGYGFVRGATGWLGGES